MSKTATPKRSSSRAKLFTQPVWEIAKRALQREDYLALPHNIDCWIYCRSLYGASSEMCNLRCEANRATKALPVPEVRPAPVLVRDTLDRWLKHKANGRKARPRTIANYRWMFNAYVKPELGDKAIAELSEVDVQELYRKLLEGPEVGQEGPKIGPKTLRNLHKALEPALKRAVSWKLLSENPAADVELPPWDREEARYLTPDQAREFLAAARLDKWYVAFR